MTFVATASVLGVFTQIGHLQLLLDIFTNGATSALGYFDKWNNCCFGGILTNGTVSVQNIFTKARLLF